MEELCVGDSGGLEGARSDRCRPPGPFRLRREAVVPVG